MKLNKGADYLIIGKVGTTHGVQGWLKIRPFTEVGSRILAYQPWFISPTGKDWHPFVVESSRVQGTTVLVKMKQISTPETARQLTGQLIAIQKESLPTLSPGEYYWSELVGLTVVNTEGLVIGVIQYLMATGSNDVMIVKTRDHKLVAIPYLPKQVIINIDLVKQEMLVNWQDAL